MTIPSYATQLPLRFGTTEQFARVSDFLKANDFFEKSVCASMKVDHLWELGAPEPVDLSHRSEQFKMLLRLFTCQSMVPCDEVERGFGPEMLETFFSLGLLGTGEYGDDQIYAQVLLYPVAGFYMVSDRQSSPDGSKFKGPEDIVFPAIYEGTLRFLRVIPRNPGKNALDLCAGPGIAAFVLSRSCEHVVSADLTERASEFARFNRYLNNLSNVEIVRGDLYGPVAGQTFDRIVAHPPYVPAPQLSQIWRDGGATGEMLVRKVIEGLPAHLNPGGLLCMVSIGLDTREGSYEERVRNWLGAQQMDFDILFAWNSEKTPREILENLAAKGEYGPEEMQQIGDAFKMSQVVSVPYGVLYVRRRATGSGQKPWTERRKLSEETQGEDFEFAFTLHDLSLQSTFPDVLLNSRLTMAPGLRVTVSHTVEEGKLWPTEYVFKCERPFASEVRFDPILVPLATSFDGQRTALEIYEKLRSQDELPPGFELQHLTELVSKMIERGFLSLPEGSFQKKTHTA